MDRKPVGVVEAKKVGIASASETLRALRGMPTAHPLVTKGMRDCQVEAITGLENSLAEHRQRALIHMATGAGKTFTACAFAYRLIKYADSQAHPVSRRSLESRQAGTRCVQ